MRYLYVLGVLLFIALMHYTLYQLGEPQAVWFWDLVL